MRTTIQPPKERYIANIQRKSNPFRPDDEPDWVPNQTGLGNDAVPGRKPGPPPPPPPRQRTVDEADPLRPSSASAMDHSPPAVPRKPFSLSSQGSRRGPSPRLSTMLQQSVSARDHDLLGPPGQASAASADLLSDTTGEQIGWKPLLPEKESHTTP